MKTSKITEAVGYLDDELLEEALVSGKRKKSKAWLKIAVAAAGIALLAGAGIWTKGKLFGGSVDENAIQWSAKYKKWSAVMPSSEIVWPWEYCTTYEKYTALEMESAQYYCSGRSVSAEKVGDKIGTYEIKGVDNKNFSGNIEYSELFEVYGINGVSSGRTVAVLMDGDYYVFKNHDEEAPGTLGGLLEQVDLPRIVTLSHFSENGDDTTAAHYTLKEEANVWNYILECKDAGISQNGYRYDADRNYLSFMISSEELGVYKVAMYITDDGYLRTNMFDRAYVYDIGAERAQRIINYAKKNSKKAKYEPYYKAIYGTVTEITEEYILIDDSVLCKDPSDGSTYRVPLSDIRISRSVSLGYVKVGTFICVSFADSIDKAENNTVLGVVRIEEAWLQPEGLGVKE